MEQHNAVDNLMNAIKKTIAETKIRNQLINEIYANRYEIAVSSVSDNSGLLSTPEFYINLLDVDSGTLEDFVAVVFGHSYGYGPMSDIACELITEVYNHRLTLVTDTDRKHLLDLCIRYRNECTTEDMHMIVVGRDMVLNSPGGRGAEEQYISYSESLYDAFEPFDHTCVRATCTKEDAVLFGYDNEDDMLF